MSKILPLGAINRKTREYVSPKVANKKDEYVCPDCNKDLTLCKGEIRIPHFRHNVDSINPCHHYSNPSESQIHKDAKILLKNLFERKIQISLIRNCCSCNKIEEFEIPEMTETSSIKLEYRIEFNGLQIPDVAYLENGEVFALFEIWYTHKTRSEKRPEPWFEIDSEKFIRLANDDSLTSLQIPCIRCEKCEECIEMENNKIRAHKKELEKYVRIKLGQKYPVPDYDEDGRIVHDRISFDAGNDFSKDNKHLIELFQNDFSKLSFPLKKYVVIHSRKGSISAFIVSEEHYKKFDYWDLWKHFGGNSGHTIDIDLPYDKIIDMCSKGTIQIIVELILYFESLKH
jgi:hypothetical protein